MRSNRLRFDSMVVPSLRRTAFTIIELLVAITILGTLLAILLPAVQSVRAASRASTCRSNLHQIGVAIADCEQATGVIPTWVKHRRSTPLRGNFWPLLPFLDQKPLWERLETNGGPPEIVEVLICPDDSNAGLSPGLVNYIYSGGTTFLDFDLDGSGILSAKQAGRKLRDIQDGLSNTAAVSERLLASDWAISSEEVQRETGRYLWWTDESYQGRGQESLAAKACREHMTTPLPVSQLLIANGFQFLADGYSHLLPPNHRACYNATEPFTLQTGRTLIPPSSNHAGGVHVLMADGQVRFVSESISDTPWQAAGTRAGHESESLL